MGNFRAYPGKWLVATEDHTSYLGDVIIKKGQVVQVINARRYFSFVGINGTFTFTGKGWEPYKVVV